MAGIWTTEGEIQTWHQMLFVLIVVLKRFDRQKYCTQKHRHQQETDQRSVAPELRLMDRQGHGQATAEQHRGVDAAQQQLEMMAPFGEAFIIHDSVSGIAHKQDAEKHDL